MADAFPHSCGLGACSKDGEACKKFVGGIVGGIFGVVTSVIGAVASGGTAIAGALASAAELGIVFGETRTCGDSYIHHRSRMAIVTVKNREFMGRHLQAFSGVDWDGCLVRCRNHGECKAIVYNHGQSRCNLLSAIGEGGDGRNAFASGVDTAVSIMRMDPASASWQFALGRGIMLAGRVMDPAAGIIHAYQGRQNLALCQLACVKDGCDFIAHSDTKCFIMKRTTGAGQNPKTLDSAMHSVMLNMAAWTDFDRDGTFPAGV